MILNQQCQFGSYNQNQSIPDRIQSLCIGDVVAKYYQFFLLLKGSCTCTIHTSNRADKTKFLTAAI